MGVNPRFMDSFLIGFTQTIQANRDRAMQEEYKKALIEQSKLQTKALENKLKLAEFDQSMKKRLIDEYFGGQSGAMPQGGPPGGAPAPSGPPSYPMAAMPGGQYGDIMAEAAQKYAPYGITPGLINAVIQAESGGRPGAVSPKGAQGLMQLMPGTAAGLGVTDPFDPHQNIMGGTKYLSQMLQRFGGDKRLALAAYNAGPGAVEKYGGIPPYKETQQYVNKVMTDQPLPQAIAQAQMTPQQALAGDILFKQYFNLDPRFRERGDVARSGTIMTPQGPQFTLFDKEGKPIKQYPAVPEYGTLPMTGGRGQPGTLFYRKDQPPGFIQTGPAPTELPKGMSDADKKIWQDNKETLSLIDSLRKFTDPKLFGFFARKKHQMYQSPDSFIAAAARGIYELAGGKPDPNLATFQSGLEAFNSAVRKQLYAGNLTENEARLFMRQAAEATSPEQFQAVLNALEERTRIKQGILEESVLESPEQMMRKPSLKLQKQRGKGPTRWRFNQSTGQMERIQ